MSPLRPARPTPPPGRRADRTPRAGAPAVLGAPGAATEPLTDVLGVGSVLEDPIAHVAGTASLDGAAEAPVAAVGRGAVVRARLRRSRPAVAGALMLTAVTALAVVGPFTTRWAYDDQDLLALGTPPSATHLLGTTSGGADVYAQLVHATGRSLVVAAVVGLGTPALAACYGAAIATWGGVRDRIGLWVLDMLLLLPGFLLVALAVGGTDGGLGVLTAVLTLTGWMPLARVVRAQSLALRDAGFVRAARYMGVPGHRIVLRHVLPNLAGFLVLQVVLATFGAVVTETALSYVGVGVRPPDVSLGVLLDQASSQVVAYPWLFWAPTVVLAWLTAGLALLGDGLRDALDPTAGSDA